MNKKLKALLLVAIIGVSCVGCGANAKTDVVKPLFTAIKETDMEAISAVLGTEAEAIPEGNAFLELIKASNEQLEYTVEDMKVDGDKATVVLNCTYGDVTKIFGTAIQSYMKTALQSAFSGEETSDEEMQKMLDEEIKKTLETTKPEPYTAKIEVHCIKKDKKWVLDDSVDQTQLADVITGNLVTALSKMGQTEK